MIYPLLPALLLSFGGTAVWLGAMEGIAEGAERAREVAHRAGRRSRVAQEAAHPRAATCSRRSRVRSSRSRPRAGTSWCCARSIASARACAACRAMRSSPSRSTKDSLATAFAFHRMMDNAGSVCRADRGVRAAARRSSCRSGSVIALAVVPGIVSCAVLVFGVKEPAGAGEDEASESESGRGARARARGRRARAAQATRCRGRCGGT